MTTWLAAVAGTNGRTAYNFVHSSAEAYNTTAVIRGFLGSMSTAMGGFTDGK